MLLILAESVKRKLTPRVLLVKCHRFTQRVRIRYVIRHALALTIKYSLRSIDFPSIKENACPYSHEISHEVKRLFGHMQ